MDALEPHNGLPPDNHPLSELLGTEPMYDAMREQQVLDRIHNRQAARRSAEAAAAPDPPAVQVGWRASAVLEALGRPDRISSGGGPVLGMEWWYYHPTRGRRWSRTVTFTEEVVTEVGP